MLKLLAPVAAGFALACSVGAETPSYEIRAIDDLGNVYVAGSGDDCAAAWQGAVLPAGVIEAICVAGGSGK